MEAIRRERERLLRRAAAVGGGALALTAFAAVVTGTPSGATAPLICAPLFLLLAVAIWLACTRAPWIGVSGTLATAIAIGLALRLVQTPQGEAMGASAATAIIVLTAGAVSATAVALPATPAGGIAFIAYAVVATAAGALLLADAQHPVVTVLWHLFGWLGSGLLGFTIAYAVPAAAEQIARIGRAHRAERDASELEAQRRQGARLLHDTVLGTLTLLAHSGVGVGEDLLRAQAGNDARLLRQLRLGETPTPMPGAPYAPEPHEDTTLAETLEAVRQRFGRMGLDVTLHGMGRVLLPQHVLDAFLLALAECLENVRRHAGVAEAHVTITEDERAVRAMITDAGVGFEVEEVDERRLGIEESVLGRLKTVGGGARVFSTPGAGTTVLLEVPK